jgi:hypothetical protein
VWGAYLPKYGDPPFHGVNHTNGGGAAVAGSWEPCEDDLDDDDEDMEEDEANSTAVEMRRNQVRRRTQ